ncbi:hypothetical protein [Frateuria sp. YIM B11624]|uniref:hypothetical protein n=1 Tax=Frateuria sp. YIM B11624 TaxID=3143185 RepID=UPI003C7197D3
MIEPYGTALKSALQDLKGLGFTVEDDQDYQAVLSDGSIGLVIGTEQYYHPSIRANVTDRNGKVYELGMARRILANRSFEADMHELDAIRKKYRLDSILGSDLPRSSGLFIYAKVAMTQLIQFASKFDGLASGRSDFPAEYAAKERDLLKSLGL